MGLASSADLHNLSDHVTNMQTEQSSHYIDMKDHISNSCPNSYSVESTIMMEMGSFGLRDPMTTLDLVCADISAILNTYEKWFLVGTIPDNVIMARRGVMVDFMVDETGRLYIYVDSVIFYLHVTPFSGISVFFLPDRKNATQWDYQLGDSGDNGTTVQLSCVHGKLSLQSKNGISGWNDPLLQVGSEEATAFEIIYK
jgi:hypothetical protein